MTTHWTFTNKPTTSWTDVDVSSKYVYDDPLVTYDSSTVQYDGLQGSSWTDVPKILIDGLWSSNTFPWLLALPWQFGSSTIWTDVPKAT